MPPVSKSLTTDSGVLGHDALLKGAIEGDDMNYVERLLAMVRSYSVQVRRKIIVMIMFRI